MPTVPLLTNNRIWLTYKHFPYKPWNAVAELVDNSSQSYFENRKALDQIMLERGEQFTVRIHFVRDSLLSVADNAMGMDLEDLARAVQLATPPPITSGRSEFGMGMKTSGCWMGDRWKIVTKKLGHDKEYTVHIDVQEIAESTSHDLPVTEKKVSDLDQHYTRIEITDLHRRLHGRTLGRTRSLLVEMFQNDVLNGDMVLEWDGQRLEPAPVEPLVTGQDDERRVWKKNVAFEVEDKLVAGWICILKKGARAQAGFDLFRRGRVIIGRPMGYRPHTIFGEMRNDLINQRLYGQLALDDFPVNHLKDDFLWDGLEDEFQEKLREVAEDYVDFARSYRTRASGQHVSPTTVLAANDELAQELTEQQMLERLTIAEVGTVADDLDDAVRDAKAESLRAQKIEPRIVEVGAYKFRIFHPENMAQSELYYFRQSADSGEIDIFLNDNHPYVLEVTDESDYLMFARMCVVDAIVEHFLVHHKGEITPSFPAKLKDNLLRGFNL
jgi:hypothetical protein